MNIEILCAAVKSSLPILAEARIGKEINHSLVEEFQKSIKEILNDGSNEYSWEIEETAKGRSEKDSIDILGKAKNALNWIIEIDATRSDQVSQKLLSRMTLWGLKEPIQYIAILYPDTKNGKNACEKYLRYGNEIIRKINSKSSVVGLFVNPSDNSIEIQQFGKWDHFNVNGKECVSMNESAAEAIKACLCSHSVSYEQLKKYWGKFILDKSGPSRYKDIKIKTADGVAVHTFTQFRQYGNCSYWTDFTRLCKKKGITILRMRKLYIGNDKNTPFEYRA